MTDLRNFGYASGGYFCKCKECRDDYLGSKRSWHCKQCATTLSELPQPPILRASELLLQSSEPFDEACTKVKELEDVLELLVELKDYKDERGKDGYYLKAQPLAWEQAREILNYTSRSE